MTVEAMNTRDVTLISSATLIGALASAFVLRFFFDNRKQHQSSSKSVQLPSTRSPFDPSKRLGFVFISPFFLFFNFFILFYLMISNFAIVNCLLLITNRKCHSYLSWDDYFMAIAFLSAQRSKDPNRQVVITFPHI